MDLISSSHLLIIWKDKHALALKLKNLPLCDLKTNNPNKKETQSPKIGMSFGRYTNPYALGNVPIANRNTLPTNS